MRGLTLFLLFGLFSVLGLADQGPHETPEPQRPEGPFAGKEASREFARYLKGLPAWETVSTDETQKSQLLEKTKAKLEPFTKDPFTSCLDHNIKEFSFAKLEDGTPTLRLKISSVEGVELKTEELEYLLQPVGVRGDWVILADPAQLGQNAWWAVRAVESKDKLDLQIMRVDVRGEGKAQKAEVSEIEYFEKTPQARCELDFLTALAAKDQRTNPGPPIPFLSIPHSDGKHALSLILTPAQKAAAEAFVQKNPGALAYGPFLFSADPKKNAEIQGMLSTYEGFKWLESRKASIKDLKSYEKIEGFLQQHDLLPPAEKRDATLLHLPYMAAMDGVIAGHIPNPGNLPETLFVYYGTMAEREAVRRANLGDNLIYTRFPVDKMDELVPPVLVHEYMHAQDETHFNYSLPMARASIEKGLARRYEQLFGKDSGKAEELPDKQTWIYYNSPVEKVAYAAEVAYMRDVEKLDFQKILSRINQMHMQHSDSRTAPEYLVSQFREFYEEKNLKRVLEGIRSEANELSAAGFPTSP